ncbi:MAG: acyl-CoA/acyl-ACP dehydrogenase [Actinobacteria bacterium]|nr:acyl-CoA/acyl-ACP dehydrogenase [Actinomycetota bacterium]
MDFDLNDEQRELRDTARRFLEREAPIAYARAMMDDERGYRDDVWKQVAEMGWLELGLPGAHGGFGFIALAIILIEMGRVVFPGPFQSSVLAALAIAEFGSDEQRAKYLPRVTAGDVIATFAHEGRVDVEGSTLKGTRKFVTDGHIAELVITPAHLSGDDAWLVIAEPVRRDPTTLIDSTTKVADLSFDGAAFERLGATTRADIHWVLRHGAVMQSAVMLGASERVLELSTEYAKQRVQFGKPIGSFQAIKHRAADMLVDVESMRNAVYYAAWALERAHPDAALGASMAKACASDAAPRVAAGGIQIHGGIGFTWEADLHLYFKRATAAAALFRDAVFHREVIAGILRARAAG